MTADEAKKLITDSVKHWEPFPGMEFGEVRGPVDEDGEYFIFEVMELDKKTGKIAPDLYEVNKRTSAIYRRVIEE